MDRVSILCRSSFVPLFDWSMGVWKEDATAPKETAALMHFFTQFAKDCGGGNILRVEFDRPSVESERRFGRSSGGGFGMQQQLNPRSSMGSRKRSTMPSAASSLPLHGNTLHMHQQQQMAMGGGGGGPIGGHASPSSVAVAASPSTASNGGASSSAQSSSGGGSGGSGGGGGGGGGLLSKGRMEMFCAQSDQVVVSIFVNADYDKNGDAVAARILSDFSSQFSAQLLAGRIGAADRMSHYPGGHEEAQADESFLPIYAGFKQTLEASGLTRLEPKASAAATAAPLTAASARDLESPPAAGGLRSLQRTSSTSGGGGRRGSGVASGGDGAGGSPRGGAAPPPPFFSSRTASTPAFRTLPGYGRAGSITGGSAAPPAAAAASASADDYLPSWIADEQDPSLLLLHSLPPMMDDAMHLQQQQLVQLSSPSTAADEPQDAAAAAASPEDQDARSGAPLLGSDQATSSPLIAARRGVGSSASPPGDAAAKLDEIQLAVQ